MATFCSSSSTYEWRARLRRLDGLLGVAVLFAGAAVTTAQSAASRPAGTRDSRIAAVIPYSGTAIAPPLTMDRYAAAGPGPHPAVIILHGGGFIGGTSRSGSEAYAADFLAPAGYEVFSINYRLSPAATLPQMVADVQRAVRFVRHNAAQYGVDPEKIALLGGSAGGYLSNMAGVLAPTADLSSADPVERESDRVQAVVTLYGISDLSTMPPIAVTYLTLMLGVTRGDRPDAALRAGSPITHVSAQAPPFLLIHGDRDEAVPFAQSVTFERALRAAGGRVELITIPGGPHATGLWSTLPRVPDWERQLTVWLNTTLGHAGEVGAGIVPRVRGGVAVSR